MTQLSLSGESLDAGSHVPTPFNTSFNLAVNELPVQSLTIGGGSSFIGVGQTKQLSVNIYPSNATNSRITWSSSNPSVATVNSNGYVTGKSEGRTTITARTSNGKSASGVITISNNRSYEGFKYSFFNTHESFGYDSTFGYVIPTKRYLQAGLPKTVADTHMYDIWGGSCFGMSMSSILFYKNIMQEESYARTIPKAFDDPDSHTDTNEIKLREMIELLQVSRYVSYEIIYEFSAKEVINELNNGNPVMLIMDSCDGAHAVVIYDYIMSEYGTYLFSIYDCSGYVTHLSYTNSNNWYFIYDDNNWSNDYTWRPAAYYVYNDLKTLHDKIKNNNKNNTASLFTLRNEPTYTYIIHPTDDMTITNSTGQASTITSGDISGEIEDIKVIPSSYLAENPTYTIILPTDTYTIVGSSDEVVTTAIADDYMSAEVTAKSSTPITISADLKDISVNTIDREEYLVKYTTYDNIFDEMTLSGIANGVVTTSLYESKVKLTGIDTLNASATVSGNAVSATSENLAELNDVTVVCEQTYNSSTIQILNTNTELTEKTSLPERLTADIPVYDLESGTYEESQTLTFTNDDDTIIYYTTDGSIPSADNGIIYSLPIDINKSMTINAVATKYGYADSEIIELNYELPVVDIPSANKNSGEYDEAIAVSFVFDEETEIYYTTDGSDPYENGILYTSDIIITEDTLLLAYAKKNGCISEICEYEYIINSKYPFFISNTPTNQNYEIISSENISDLKAVNLNLEKLWNDTQSGTFIVAFYDDADRMIMMNIKEAEISQNTDTVSIEIPASPTNAKTMKIFTLNDMSNISPISLSETYIIN